MFSLYCNLWSTQTDQIAQIAFRQSVKPSNCQTIKLYIYFHFPILCFSLHRLNRALEDSNRLRGELQAAEREKKEAKVLLILHGYKNMLKNMHLLYFGP